MKLRFFTCQILCLRSLAAGTPVEVSQKGNVLYQIATAAIARGAAVSVDLSTLGGVKTSAGSGTFNAAYAFDKAAAAGDMIRVSVLGPAYVTVVP